MRAWIAKFEVRYFFKQGEKAAQISPSRECCGCVCEAEGLKLSGRRDRTRLAGDEVGGDTSRDAPSFKLRL